MNVASHISHANAFTPCGSLHDSSSDNCEWMLHHIFLMKMPSLHVGRYMTLKLTTVVECKITYFTCKWLHSMWVTTWLFNWQLWINVASHISHANALTPCRSLHDSSSDNCEWMLHHMFLMQMPSLHVGRYMTLKLKTVVECKITYLTCKWLHSMWVATWLYKWQLW